MPIDPGKRAQRALRVVRSTTAESLCEELAVRISARWAAAADGLPRIGPFDRVAVAVQGKGLERWMRRRLAQRLGVVGGIETPYLRRFLFDVAGVVTGGAAASRERDDVRELAYRIAQEIAERCASRGGAPGERDADAARGPGARHSPDAPGAADAVPRVDPAHVLPLVTDREGSSAHPHALLSAGHRIAAIFDALEVERPELVVAWREGRPLPDRAPWLKRDAPDHSRLSALCGWMHRLWWWTAGPGRAGDASSCWSGHRSWQSVRDAIAVLSSDSAWGKAREAIEARSAADGRAPLPAMVSVFGVSSLPPLALDFLAALGSRIDVTLHLVVPTDRYMDESIMGRSAEGEPDEGHLDSLWSRGHRLLAVCGRQPMSMQQRLLSLAHVEDVDCGDSAGAGPVGAAAHDGDGDAGSRGATSLHALQQSLREGTLMDRERAGDGSVSVHLVSGATRAAEVLRDQVLDAFASLPGTGPDDVLVLTTDVERYGTAIMRAMSAAAPRPMPVTLADRSVRVEREVVRTFCDAMRILDGELTLEALGEVVASGPVADRAGVSVEECGQCLEHLHAVGARRFIDAEHRHRVLSAVGGTESIASTPGGGAIAAVAGAGAGTPAPDAPDGTVEDAQDRLAMSMAMWQEVGGTQLPGMARVCAAIAALMALGRRTAEARTMREWCGWSRELLDAVVQRRSRSSDEGDLAAQRAAILEAIESVAASASRAALDVPLPFAAARGEIVDAIDRGAVGRRFGASGGVMVGGLVPMRSVPSRIVALVGLDRGAFPRRDERPGIDPRRWSRGSGDRNARDEDRALFLEAIHAAGDRLIIISTAIDAASGEVEPASPLVDILTEQCGAAVRVTRHGVHAFGDEEWSDASAGRPRRDAHARRCALARRVGAGADAKRRILCPDIRSPVHVSAALLARVGSVDRIVACAGDPARWWLESVGARIASMEPDTDEREPGGIGSLERWALQQALAEQAVSGAQASVDAVVAAHRMVGALPAGAAAESVARDLREWLDGKLMRSPGFSACPAAPHEWSVDGPGGPVAARGWRSAEDPGTQVLFRGGSWRARHAVEIALRAVAWAAAGGTRTVVLPKPEPECRMPAEIVWGGTASDAARAIDMMRRIAAAGMVVPLCFHPMLLADADMAGLAAGNGQARADIARTLEQWLSRSSDDLARGDVDGRAMRVALQGMGALDVLGGPRADAVHPPADIGGRVEALAAAAEAREGAGAGAAGDRAAVRTDFDGVWPVVERLLAACGWTLGAGGGAVP